MPGEETDQLWDAIDNAIKLGALTLDEIILLINPMAHLDKPLDLTKTHLDE